MLPLAAEAKLSAPRACTATLTGADLAMVAATAGIGVKIWQVVLEGTATDPIVLKNGTTTQVTIRVPANASAVLPFSGSPWAFADAGNALNVNGAATTIATLYYTQD